MLFTRQRECYSPENRTSLLNNVSQIIITLAHSRLKLSSPLTQSECCLLISSKYTIFRLESIRLRPICQFAYVLNPVLWQLLYKTIDSIETKIDDVRKLSHENLISQLMKSNDYHVNWVHLTALWHERQIDLTLFATLDKCYDIYQCCNCTLIFKLL